MSTHAKPEIRPMAIITIAGMKTCFNLSDMAKRTHISVAHLSGIFGGRRNPSWPAAIAIAADLGWSLDDLAEALTRRREKWKRARN